jgi:hypothetical protein
MASRSGADSGDRDAFYIEEGCCVLCGVPEEIAPELFRTGDKHCHLLRQPCSPSEVDKTIEAMWSSEVDCIRYGGSDGSILKRIGEAGMALLADDPQVASFPPQVRDRVSFSVPGSPNGAELAASFRAHVRSVDRLRLGFSFHPQTVRLSWWRRNFHSVTFQASRDEQTQAALLAPAFPSALQGLARVVDEWLRSARGAQHIVWHTRETSEGRPTPI